MAEAKQPQDSNSFQIGSMKLAFKFDKTDDGYKVQPKQKKNNKKRENKITNNEKNEHTNAPIHY